LQLIAYFLSLKKELSVKLKHSLETA